MGRDSWDIARDKRNKYIAEKIIENFELLAGAEERGFINEESKQILEFLRPIVQRAEEVKYNDD